MPILCVNAVLKNNNFSTGWGSHPLCDFQFAVGESFSFSEVFEYAPFNGNVIFDIVQNEKMETKSYLYNSM